jgi:hypothetical protein
MNEDRADLVLAILKGFVFAVIGGGIIWLAAIGA